MSEDTKLPPVQVVGSVFTELGQDGDFAYMIEQPENARSLFVFNDNVGQFQAYQQGITPGGGNAVIRDYQAVGARSAGVPTGPGFDTLDDPTRQIIDSAIAYISHLLSSGRFDTLIYSADPADHSLLGHGIFDVAEDVRRYVVAELRKLGTVPASPTGST